MSRPITTALCIYAALLTGAAALLNVNASSGLGGGYVRDNEKAQGMIATQTALGRPGRPDDVGRVMTFLLSKVAGWISGETIEVSGGTRP